MINSFEIFGTPSQRIMDPVHGSIPIFSHEMRVIDDPLFQRLRGIIQNDVVFMVYPGARHNRFLHSIGTMHMVSLLYKQLITAYIVKGKKAEVTGDEKESIAYIHCSLRLAALLHDAGHCPFSHQFENSEGIHNIFNKTILDNWLLPDQIEKYLPKEIESFSHEHLSIAASLKILNRIHNLDDIFPETEDVLFFLEKTTNPPSTKLLEYCKSLMNLFAPGLEFQLDDDVRNEVLTNILKFLKILISGEIDADKMDYLVRDSYFSGVPYGKYNKDHLINSLRVAFQVHRKKDSSKIVRIDYNLAILDKGLFAFEDFVYCRYQMYLELYNHKTVSGFRKLLSLSIQELLKDKAIKNEIGNKLKSENGFAAFTDTFFWEKFSSYADKNSKSACSMIIARTKLKYYGKEDKKTEKQVIDSCKLYFKQTSKVISYWKSKVKFSDIQDSYYKIKVLKEDSQGKFSLDNVSVATDFFSKFKGKEIYHLFEIPPELIQ